MPTVNVRVVLVDQAGFKVEALGLRPDDSHPELGPVTVNRIQLTRKGTVDPVLVGVDGKTVTIPEKNVDSTGGKDALKLKPGDVSLKEKLSLKFESAATTNFLGATFSADVAAKIDADVTVSVPIGPAAPEDEPLLVLRVTGLLQLNADGDGGTVFAEAAMGVVLIVDRIDALPQLAVDLPGNIKWPRFRIPFPTLGTWPGFPIRIPAGLVSFPELPGTLRISWKLMEINVDVAKKAITIHVVDLRIEGLGGLAIEATLLLSVGKDKIDVKVEKTNIPEALRDLGLTVTDGCIAGSWKGKSVNQFLSLVAPEFVQPDFAAEADFQLRVRLEDTTIKELRLDVVPPNGQLDLTMPGIIGTIPKPKSYLLIVQTANGGSGKVAFLANFAKDDTGALKTTFAWPLQDGATGPREKRERLNDAGGESSAEFLTANVKAVEKTSLVLFDLAYSKTGSKPTYFYPLKNYLQELAPADTCPVSDLTEAGNWDAIKANLKLAASEFKFPFLNPLNQYISIKARKDSVELTDKGAECPFDVTVYIHKLNIDGEVTLAFEPKRMAFSVKAGEGLTLSVKGPKKGTLFDIDWEFRPNQKNELFVLATKNNYQLRLATGAELILSYSRATSKESPIKFTVTEFALTPGGITLTATIKNDPARLNGLQTQFTFTDGTLKIVDNQIAGFTICGSGPLPDKLIDNASADIALQFEQNSSGRLRLVSGAAQIKGPKLLECRLTRFEFELDGLGLKFVDDEGGYHLYFTLSGKARYKLQSGDDSSGALAWLPGIEMQLVDCPLTGDMRVIAKHVKFLIDLPKKASFDFLGCFKMELRGIGFLPQFDGFGETTSAMVLSGQIMFAQGTGDVVETKVDFHNLHIALPEPGSIFPRLHLKGLTVHINAGESFRLYGAVSFFDGEDIEPGIPAKGFTGEGELSIQGLPTFAAAFGFLRVSPDAKKTWKRAWFIYLEARELSIRMPVIQIALREVGLGFGYRYTLASFKAIDNINDPRKLLKELKRLARTQGNLSKRDQWRVDLEKEGEDPRWTIVLRALFSQVSAQKGPWGDYKTTRDFESTLSCLFVFDVVIALRSDLTFFMAGRGWLNTNYVDFHDKEELRDHPLFAAFLMLSPRQKRFLANLSSQPDSKFGDHPPLPEFVKRAISKCQFSATLLIEPGLVHHELGWPNQLRWGDKIGPLEAEFRGGMILRVSDKEFVQGLSFLARGKLSLGAEVSAGFFGASLSALAQVAYGARYIGVLAFRDIENKSAFYGAVGVEIRVVVDVSFWIKIKLLIKTITLNFGFSFSLNFTASLEVGITLTNLLGLHGTATIGLQIMGHSLNFDVRVGLNDAAVDKARRITEPFLHIGLEAEEVEPVPGTGAAVPAAFGLVAPDPAAAPLAIAAAAPEPDLDAPDYLITTAIPPRANGAVGDRFAYYLLLPAASKGERSRFFPIPPEKGKQGDVTADFIWEIPKPEADVTLQHFHPTDRWSDVDTTKERTWKIDWPFEFNIGELSGSGQQNGEVKTTLQSLFRYAYIRKVPPTLGEEPDFEDFRPELDPPMISKGQATSDARVLNPTATAFEAAVRGASDRLSAPYFRFDPDNKYDSMLRKSFQPDTSIYLDNGKGDADAKAAQLKRATQLRGAIMQAVLRDFQRYAELASRSDQAAIDDRKVLEDTSLAFRLGLVFRGKVKSLDLEPQLRWLDKQVGKIKQRIKVDATKPDSDSRNVTAFHTADDSFTTNPPRFLDVRTYEHANTIAIHWILRWPEKFSPGNFPEEPEHFLRYYRVRRVHLDGNDPEVEFTMKSAPVLHKEGVDGKPAEVFSLTPRFQLVDHFDDEVGGDIAALTEEGKSYLYTIIPVDLEGNESARPLTIVATRFPDNPPLVPTDAEFIVEYSVGKNFENVLQQQDGDPLARQQPVLIEDKFLNAYVRWTPPVSETVNATGPIATYWLIFRKEKTLPVGFFGAEQSTEGNRHQGFPASRARRLRTDVALKFQIKDAVPSTTLPGTSIVKIDVKDLERLGVLPAASNGLRRWRPEGWQIFVQTQTPKPESGRHGGVFSTMVPVKVRYHFVKKAQEKKDLDPPSLDSTSSGLTEQRLTALLEWVPSPLRFNLLPPADQKGKSGDALVPMPGYDAESNTKSWIYDTTLGSNKDDQNLKKLRFEKHPDDIRAIEFVWNQGPSRSADHPLELHARYDLFEFDCDKHTGEVLDAPAGKTRVDLLELQQRAHLRPIQNVELLPAADLALVPGDTLTAKSWEAWYPAISRRLTLKRKALADHTWPARSEAALGPWFSWRESSLLWPATFEPIGNFVPNEKDQPPPEFDPETNQLWPVHPFWRMVLARIQKEGEIDPNDPTVTGRAKFDPTLRRQYSIELQPAPTRAAGDNVNTGPARPTGFAAFRDETGPSADPYGWSLLQRMGLCAAFRVRNYRTGEYVRGAELAHLVRKCLADAIKVLKDPLTISKFLHVEYLFQPGERTRIDGKEPPQSDNLLAIVQLSLRPAVRQQLLYAKWTFNNNDVPAGTSVTLTVTIGGETKANYLLTGGSVLEPAPLEKDITINAVMPGNGELIILVRTVNPLNVNVHAEAKIKSETFGGNLTRVAVSATDWETLLFTAHPEAVFNAPDWLKTEKPTPDDENDHWDRLLAYLSRITAVSKEDLGKKENNLPLTQIWLDRFFGQGGDVDVKDATKPATTLDGPWIASAYLRAMTPMALTPRSGRITYRHWIEDQWAHAYRYLIRPNGRYDLLWAGLGQATRLIESEFSGKVSRAQRWIDVPALEDVGGTDIVLPRTRRLAAPLVLSSRRLDRPGLPQIPVPPGAIWEVIVARHPEQTLIDSNRTLMYQLAYRQISHALFRTSRIRGPNGTAAGTWAELINTQKSGAYKSENELMAQPPVSNLWVFDKSDNSLTQLDPTSLSVKDVAAKLTAIGHPAEVVPIEEKKSPCVLRIASDKSLELRTLKDEPRSNLLTAKANWQDADYEVATGAALGRFVSRDLFDKPTSPIPGVGGKRTLELGVFSADRSEVSILTLAANEVGKIPESLDLLFKETPASYVRIKGELRTEYSDGKPKSRLVLIPDQPVGLVELRPIADDGKRLDNLLRYDVPGLPQVPESLDHLNLTPKEITDPKNIDDLLSLDLPFRSTDFTRGAMVLQFRSLPYFYKHKLLLVAQCSHVVSPITELEHQDFEYDSPNPLALMEGVAMRFDSRRQRRIVIQLARYWDCLPAAAQRNWQPENPSSVSDPKQRRESSVPDPDVVYQIVLERASSNIEVVAEFAFDPVSPSGYKASKIKGPFEGIPVRLLPDPDGGPPGTQFVRLETLLLPTVAQSDSLAFEPVTSRHGFKDQQKLAQTFANVLAGEVAKPEEYVKYAPGACILRTTRRLKSSERDELAKLLLISDIAFASAIRSLLLQADDECVAPASLGLEQLRELVIDPASVVFADVAGRTDIKHKIVWKDDAKNAPYQVPVLKAWTTASLFDKTLGLLAIAIESKQIIRFVPSTTLTKNPDLPEELKTRLKVEPEALSKVGSVTITWSKIDTNCTAEEHAALTTFKDHADWTAEVKAALSDLLSELVIGQPNVPTVDIVEADWTPRPIQATLPKVLQEVLQIGHGVIGFLGLMTRTEAGALRSIKDLPAVDQKAIDRLFERALQSGLDGGTLKIRARKGSAVPSDLKVISPAL